MGWLDEIGPKTGEFLKEFGPIFLKSYGIELFLKIKADYEAEKAAAKPSANMLMYRDSTAAKPTKPAIEGDCWYKEGDGEGAFSGWSACYLVQLPDYNLAVYRDAKSAALNNPTKAKMVIKPAGYRLKREVTAYYDAQARVACEELQCEKPDVGYSQYSWALVHGMRTNFIFQLHKGVGGGGCACLGQAKVEPAESGAENAGKAAEWATAMERCIANSSPRNLDSSVVAKAFERTVKKMSLNLSELTGFSDDGTEGQILAHMVFLSVFEAACKDDAQEQLRQAPFGHLSLWFKARGSAAAVIEKAVDAGWGALQKQAEAQTARLETKIKPLLGAILQKKDELQDLLRTQVGERIGAKLNELFGAVLKEISSGLVMPMSNGVKAILDIYEKEMGALLQGKSTPGILPPETAAALDLLPKDDKKLGSINQPAEALLARLAQIKASPIGQALSCLNPRETEAKLRQSLAKLLDGMVFTTLEEMKTGEKDPESVKLDVLARAKADAVSMQKAFVSRFFVDLLLGQLKAKTKEFVDPAIQSAQSVIPEDLSEIIDLDAEYNTLLEITIGAAIGKAFEPK